jgi:hypothetical protein
MSSCKITCAAILIAGGCHAPGDGPGLGAPDLSGSRPSGPLRLVDRSITRPLIAYYSIAINVRPERGESREPVLVVTCVDPAYPCVGRPSGSVDLISLGFLSFASGTGGTLISRQGPRVGPTMGTAGYAQLDSGDVRYGGVDGGVIIGAGGHATGAVTFELAPDLALEGLFDATYCQALDFYGTP